MRKVIIRRKNWDDFEDFRRTFEPTEGFGRRRRTYYARIGRKSKKFSSVEGCYNFWLNNNLETMEVIVEGFVPKRQRRYLR